ncbi:hypothetical protein EYR01_23445 [Xanthomonas oryzae pv. oryzae]|nr:hypothetical protein EYR01_23445 [Xanthomonas oryzae pv. oryzae]
MARAKVVIGLKVAGHHLLRLARLQQAGMRPGMNAAKPGRAHRALHRQAKSMAEHVRFADISEA